MPELVDILSFLFKETVAEAHRHHHHDQRILHQIGQLDSPDQFRFLQKLLCQRSASPPLPNDILNGIDAFLLHQRSHRLLAKSSSINPSATFLRRDGQGRISLWKGDITRLADTTLIVNAANSQGLGCFQPTHLCIDNVIHSWAGPRLRMECEELMSQRGRELEPGETIVTQGHCLPAAHVAHTVGPQLRPGSEPSERHIGQLSECYRSVLEAAETLSSTPDGAKRVVFCGISTGLFAFPAPEAASVATKAVAQWLQEHEDTSITDVIFNVFSDEDLDVYENIMSSPPSSWTRYTPAAPATAEVESPALDVARQWLGSAETVLVSAGAGLSAAAGLDFTSKALFAKHHPGCLKFGLETLYDTFGCQWPTEEDRWGYTFSHIDMIRTWPKSDMYMKLLGWLETFGPNAHVRTSNGDGLFAAHDWPASQMSTPQGSLGLFQCLEQCRPEAVVPSHPIASDAVSSIDPASGQLLDLSKVPVCQYCGGEMDLCVRMDHRFNERPFEKGEAQWAEFRRKIKESTGNVVILELGVGRSTPGVLKWPNEKLARDGGGSIKLIRVGMGPDAAVSRELEEDEMATWIDGDFAKIIDMLL